MSVTANLWKKLAAGLGHPPPSKRRRAQRMEPTWDCLEERRVLSHGGGLHQNAVAFAQPLSTAGANMTAHTSIHPNARTAASLSTGTTSTTSSELASALQTLHDDVQKIELASGTTVGQLAAIRAAFRTLAADGLTPSSRSALSAFEDSLVTAFASGTTLTGNATLLAQFEALYTSSPTAQQTTDLTNTYNALAAAVTSSNITADDITTISNDWAAVLAARNSTSTATYPYFSLVTGGGRGAGGGGGCH
jgi:hypothetical protein